MLKRRMAVMALTAAGTISACDSMGPGPPLVSKAVAEQAADRRETSRLDQVAGGSTVKNKPEMGFDSEAPSEESANWKPESALRSSFDDCWSSAGGDAAKLACIHKELSYQDFELNKNYKRLKEILGDKDRALLIEEQRQWLGETESACGALGNNLDGDVDPVYCRLYRTAQRSQELQTMIELERE